MEAGGGDEGCNEANEVVVHVTRVTEGCGTGSHYGRDLGCEEQRGQEKKGDEQKEPNSSSVTVAFAVYRPNLQQQWSPAHQVVDLREGGLSDSQSFSSDPVESRIIQHHLQAWQ